MADNKNLPAISLQVTELVLAGSTEHAEEAFNEAAEKFGDLVVVQVLDSLEPQVAAMHLSAFDGGKLSLATMLISPKAWAESLAFFAATWSEDMIEDEPEVLTESLFTHIHGVIFSTDDAARRTGLIHEALSTDWGTTAFAVLFSTTTQEIVELALAEEAVEIISFALAPWPRRCRARKDEFRMPLAELLQDDALAHAARADDEDQLPRHGRMLADGFVAAQNAVPGVVPKRRELW